jgi:hypothetical protein
MQLDLSTKGTKQEGLVPPVERIDSTEVIAEAFEFQAIILFGFKKLQTFNTDCCSEFKIDPAVDPELSMK